MPQATTIESLPRAFRMIEVDPNRWTAWRHLLGRIPWWLSCRREFRVAAGRAFLGQKDVAATS